MQDVQIHDCFCMEKRKKKDHNLYRSCKLFMSKDRLEVVRVDCGVASIPPFRINIPSSSESIWFDTKITRAEPNDKVELGEVLGPLCLLLDQYCCSNHSPEQHSQFAYFSKAHRRLSSSGDYKRTQQEALTILSTIYIYGSWSMLQQYLPALIFIPLPHVLLLRLSYHIHMP